MKKLTLILIWFFFIFFYACSWMDTKAYYATHATFAEDVEFRLGKPIRVEMLENGTVKWIYFIQEWINDEHYFIIREGRVVDAGFN